MKLEILESLKTDVTKHTGDETFPVLFSAYSSRTSESITGSGENLIFEDILVNSGNAYNPTTGVFQAPLNGIYEFSFSCYHDFKSPKNVVEVMKNGRMELAIQGSSMLGWHDGIESDKGLNFGSNWMMSLKKGDRINLRVSMGTVFSAKHANKIFTGKFLIQVEK